MASIYIHIPFCKQKCHYCNFFSTVNLRQKKELINSIILEIYQKRNYINNQKIESIYFGGGTPSIIEAEEIKLIFDEIKKHFEIEPNCEITFELNPDDINEEYLKAIKAIGINRLSIGIQSFNDDILKQLNRVHSASEAKKSIIIAKNIGFENINIDLIYAIPGLSLELWKEELDFFLSLNIPHLSAYSLTVEPKTTLAHLIKHKKYPELIENEGLMHSDYLVEFMKNHNYIHYEISNFSLIDKISRHNSNYWKRKPYIGIGPSAHSFNLNTRQWNYSSISKYIYQIQNNISFEEIENLNEDDKFNEFVMLGLRTSWGVDLDIMQKEFDKKYYEHFLNQIEKYKISEKIIIEGNKAILTKTGKNYADYIASNLFYL